MKGLAAVFLSALFIGALVAVPQSGPAIPAVGAAPFVETTRESASGTPGHSGAPAASGMARLGSFLPSRPAPSSGADGAPPLSRYLKDFRVARLPSRPLRGPVSRDGRHATTAASPSTTALQPSATPKRVYAATGRRQVRGIASFYCSPGAPYYSRCTVGYPADSAVAAAGPALRVGQWRGRWVTVCYPDCARPAVAVQVRLVDCNCGPNANLIDLYGGIFAQLAPGGLGQGVMEVEVTW